MKTSIEKITLIIAIAIIPQLFLAQQQMEKPQDKEAAKIAFFTNKMDLTTEESKVFWPVVNEMEAELKSIRADFKDNYRKPKQDEELSDMELEKMMDARMDLGKKQMDVKIKYHEKFKQILPIKKVAKYYESTTAYKKIVKQRKKRRIQQQR